MCLDEVPSAGAVSFADLGVKPQVLADQIVRFTRYANIFDDDT